MNIHMRPRGPRRSIDLQIVSNIVALSFDSESSSSVLNCSRNMKTAHAKMQAKRMVLEIWNVSGKSMKAERTKVAKAVWVARWR